MSGTPRPWRLKNEIEIVDAAGHTILLPHDGSGYVRLSPKDYPLIATAPELLDKLRGMTLLFKSALLLSTPEIAKEGMKFVREADALIAKATGDAS